MKFIQEILSRITMRSPDKFIKKFLKDSLNKPVQLELFYQNTGLLQVQSLKYFPSWLEKGNVVDDKYENGYVIIVIVNKIDTQIVENLRNLNMVKYEFQQSNSKKIISFLYFFEKDVTSVKLGKYMRKVIDAVYKFQKKNPQILFNLRYL